MIEVLRTAEDVRAWRNAQHGPVGFVPTMGYLHDGHLSLIREARARVVPASGVVLVSIFVNPTQFGPGEDLDRYPRDEDGDLVRAAAAGADAAFCPRDPTELYPSRATWVDVEGLGEGLCGRSRPGHFRGVCTVVAKLWGLVRPDLGVFGHKDYQQLAIIRRMHTDLFLSGEVVGMPIVRESDGLAMSSRNAHLSVQARREALAIPRFLGQVRRRFEDGIRDGAGLLVGAPQALAPGTIDYVELVDAQTLASIETVERPALVALAVFFGGVRLIDNDILGS
jgi:pantoate--beta-alanine ligase